MKRIIIIATVAFVLFWMIGCEPPVTNKPANTNANANANANTAKSSAAAPTKEALLAMDKQANEAAMKGDGKFFEGFLSDKFVSFDRGMRMDKAATVSMLSTMKCELKTWTLDDPQMTMIDADTAVITYKGTFDGTCEDNGKSMKIPSPTRSASIYVRSGDKWLGAYHGENLIIDPKNPPPAPPMDKKADAKKDEKSDANSNTAAAKPAVGDANTEALVKLHTAGWEAFKAKDAKKFEDMTAATLSVVDPMGVWIGNKADVIKRWTADMKCEGVNNVKVSDGVATALSPTVELLTLKGSADGTCDGMKNGTLNQTALYVKEGDIWKLAFMFESPAM